MPKCKECGFRIRGKKHEKGDHHKKVIAEQGLVGESKEKKNK